MKVLIANRGEIAVRVIRACRELGLGTVAVHSDCDRAALHVRYADEAYPLGGDLPQDSYLRVDRIIDIARRSGATAVHPGYGFLAENAGFARACEDAGLTFIGPSPGAMEAMGNKTAARAVAMAAGVPVVPGLADPLPAEAGDARIFEAAEAIGFPILVKAVAGGGGKGMRAADGPADLLAAVRLASAEAQASFGDPRVYLERRLVGPRHIEIQLIGDRFGTIVPLVERECSIQRRHQKVLEESPSVVGTPALRAALAEAARRAASAVGYTNAGTVEFLVDQRGEFFFLEMNTRLQVEHPITELVTGIDLVQWQLRVARGERLAIDPEQALAARGHAIECRIYAEDPDNEFLPSPGRVLGLRVPAGPGIRRDDGGVTPGLEVPVHYDPLIAKLSAWGANRAEAIARMARALGEYEVRGIKTTIPFFRWLLESEAFVRGAFDTTSLDRELASRAGRPFLIVPASSERVALLAASVRAYDARVAPGAAREAGPPGAWRRQARLDALR